VRTHFALSARQPDGSPLRAHLQQAAKMGSVAAAATLREVGTPGVLGYLWDWFLELHNRRGAGMSGPGAITWPDLDAWARRTRRNPLPWEFDVIGTLDNTFFDATLPPPEAKP
jgi:hypothetical protein